MWNKRNYDAAEKYFAPQVVFHDLNPNFDAGTPLGLAAVKTLHQMWVTAFPDVRVTVHDIVKEGDKLAARLSFTGTHRGTFLKVPATGKRVTVANTVFYQINNGKITDVWSFIDLMGLMQQIGSIASAEERR